MVNQNAYKVNEIGTDQSHSNNFIYKSYKHNFILSIVLVVSASMNPVFPFRKPSENYPTSNVCCILIYHYTEFLKGRHSFRNQEKFCNAKQNLKYFGQFYAWKCFFSNMCLCYEFKIEFNFRCSLKSNEIRDLYLQGNQAEADESTCIRLLPLDEVLNMTGEHEMWKNMAPSSKGCITLAKHFKFWYHWF